MQPLLAPALLMCLCVPLAASADSWRYPSEETRDEFTFGDTRIVRIVDARKDTHYPAFAIEVRRGRTLLARYPGASFDQVFAAPDHSLFVGLSNSGLPATAVIILRGDGELVLEAKHGLARFAYCDESVTLVRRWYNHQTTAVEFVKDEATGGYTRIRLHTCDGRQVDLVAEVVQAYQRAAAGSGESEPADASESADSKPARGSDSVDAMTSPSKSPATYPGFG